MGFDVIDSSGRLKIVPTTFIGEFSTTSTGNIDDLDFSNASFIRMNNATLSTIRGLKAGYGGQQVTIVSVGAGQVNLSHQDTGDATAANRLINPITSGVTPLAPGKGTAVYEYDATTARWRLLQHSQGAWIEVAYSAGNFTSVGGGAWTVDSGDQRAYGYYLVGSMLNLRINVADTDVAASPGITLQIPLPLGLLAEVQQLQPNLYSDAGSANIWGYCFTTAGGNTLGFRKIASDAWTVTSGDNTAVSCNITMGVT